MIKKKPCVLIEARVKDVDIISLHIIQVLPSLNTSALALNN